MEFQIRDGSGLFWLAPRDLGGLAPAEFAGRASTEGSIRKLVEHGALVPIGLFEDSGFVVRMIFDELSSQEAEEWVASARGWLDLECGAVVIAGALAPMHFEADFARFTEVTSGTVCEHGGWVRVDPGRYAVEVFSYAPADLSGVWNCFTEPEDYGTPEGIDPEDPADWLARARPGVNVPWFDNQSRTAGAYVSFVVRLSPIGQDTPKLDFDDDGHLKWTYRRPERFPLGIRMGVR